MISSLRYRLLIGASLSGAVVLGLLGIGIYFAMRHALMNEFDSTLRAEARLLSGMLEQRDEKLSFEFDSQQMPDYVSRKSGRFFQLWRADGTVLARSLSLGDRQLQRISAAPDAVVDMVLFGDDVGRAVVLNISPGQEERRERDNRARASRLVTIVAAAEPISVNHTLRLLGLLLGIGCALAVMIMGMVLLRMVSEGVRPVNKLAGEIESLTETALGRRFSRAGVPDELRPVVDKLNGLMGRLEGAFAREKSFTADVAHELRTPLTGLRTTLEVCRSQPRESAAYETALDECRAITDRMEAMVESLLLLARSDAGQVVVTKQRVDLSELIAETWCLFEYRAQRSNVNVSFDMPHAVVIETDPDKLRIVIQNVLDNAVSYVDPGGQIRIKVHRQGNDAIAEIANSGSQIAAEDASRLFERFWRGDVARTDAGAHCGLGLSLCQRLMNLLGGQIAVETAKGGQFVLRIHIAV